MKPDTEVAQLWTEYGRTRSDALRNRLIEHYRFVVHMAAARLAQKLPAQVTYDEICSAGYDGLLDAVEAYESCRHIKFETFCQLRIRGAIMDWIRTLDTQSRTVRSFEKHRDVASEQLRTTLGRPATNPELAAQMSVSVDRLDELSSLSRLGHEVHLSAIQNDNDSHKASTAAWDLKDGRTKSPAARAQTSSVLTRLTRGLNYKERLVLILYYVERLTMQEIGVVVGLTESRISQMHKDVIARLRATLPRHEFS